MPRKNAHATAGMKQPTVVSKKTTKGRNSARTSTQKGTEQEVPTRRQRTAVAGNKTTKRSHPDGVSAPKTTEAFRRFWTSSASRTERRSPPS